MKFEFWNEVEDSFLLIILRLDISTYLMLMPLEMVPLLGFTLI